MTNNEALIYLIKLTDDYWYSNFQLNFYNYHYKNIQPNVLSKLKELNVPYIIESTMLENQEKVYVNIMDLINHKAKVRDNKINSILDINENE